MKPNAPGYDDPFRPPEIPTEVFCLHCRQTYESYLIDWMQTDAHDQTQGFWCCPTRGCDGKGFLFDIFPTDPEWRDEDGNKVGLFDEDEENGEFDEGEFDENEFDEDVYDGPDFELDEELEADEPHLNEASDLKFDDTGPDTAIDEDDIPF